MTTVCAFCHKNRAGRGSSFSSRASSMARLRAGSVLPVSKIRMLICRLLYRILPLPGRVSAVAPDCRRAGGRCQGRCKPAPAPALTALRRESEKSRQTLDMRFCLMIRYSLPLRGGFSDFLEHLDPLAQSAEHLTFNQGVPRSSRGWVTILCNGGTKRGRGGMADAPDLGSGASGRKSSSLFVRTKSPTALTCGSSSVGRAQPCQG